MAGQLPDLRMRITIDGGNVKASFDGINRAVSDFTSGIQSGVSGANNSLTSLASHVEALHESMESLRNIGEIFLGFEAIKRVTESLTDANIEIQRVHFSLQAALGTTQAANNEFNFLYATSQKLGVAFGEIAGSYGNITASGKAAGVTLAQTRNLFTALNEAATVFHLSAQQVHAAMLGIEQSFAQGSFRTQELRQQIGQQLPGVFENFANRVKASGQDFNKLLATGSLNVREYVDTLTASIRDAYNPEALEEASSGLNANLNRAKNSILLFKSQLGGGIIEDVEVQALKALSEVLENISNSPLLKGTQIAILVASFLALGRGASALSGYMLKLVKGANDWYVANNKTGAAAAASTKASIELSSAQSRLIAIESRLAVEEAELAAVRAKAAGAATQETAAEIANAEAKVASTTATRAEIVAEVERAAAVRAGAVATAEAAGATTTMGVAMGGLATAGRGLLAVFGGIPGIIAAVVTALVLFVDWTDDAAKAAKGLDDSTKELAGSVKAAGQALTDYYNLKQQHDNPNPNLPTVTDSQLSYARQQAIEGLNATEGAKTNNDAKVLQITKDLTAAQERLNKARKDAGPESTQVNFTTGTVGNGPNPEVIRAQREVYELKTALDNAKAGQKALTTVNKAGTVARADDTVMAAKEASDRSLLAIQQGAVNETSTRKAALEKQKSNYEQVQAEILAKQKEYAEQNKALSAEQIKAGQAAVAKAYAPALEAAQQQDLHKKKTNPATAARAEVRANDQLANAVESVTKAQKTLDATMTGQTDPIMARILQLENQLDEARRRAIQTVQASTATDAQKKAALDQINAGYDQSLIKIKAYQAQLKQQAEDKNANDLSSFVTQLAQKAKTPVEQVFDQLDQQYTQLQLKLEAAHLGPNDAQYQAAMQTWEEYQKKTLATFDKQNDKVGQFAVQAARTIQSQLGQGLLDAFNGNWDSIRSGFSNLLKQMVAQVAASKLAKWLFGDFDTTGKVGGAAGGITKTLASLFVSNKSEAPAATGGGASGGGFLSSIGGFFSGLFGRRQPSPSAFPDATGPVNSNNAAQVAADIAKEQSAQSEAVKSNTAATAASAIEQATAGTSLASFGQIVGVAGTLLSLFQTATTAATAAQTAAAASSTVKAFAATGGEIHGPGTATSDSIPAQLSDGEFVVNAAATSRFLPLLHHINSGAKAPKRGKLHLAAGGMVKQVGSSEPAGSRPIRLINAVDPNYVHDQMGSTGGEKAILNVIGRNSRTISQQLNRA